jgi:hypothetical protein
VYFKNAYPLSEHALLEEAGFRVLEIEIVTQGEIAEMF